VSNEEAKVRLLQMGERKTNIYVIGSPDMDLMTSNDLPSLPAVKDHYGIDFEKYSLFVYHSVTTNLHNLLNNIQQIIETLVKSEKNYIVIYPNNDAGSDVIIEELELLRQKRNFRVFPSIRFESFLTLLKNCEFIIGNSSAGIREAPYYGIPTVNIGNRQNGRFIYKTIINVGESREKIMAAINMTANISRVSTTHFGDGQSAKKFLSILNSPAVWDTGIQKQFCDDEHVNDKDKLNNS
jgi:UDP-N-acetylglucosamine 2-epimerase (hydrolysing)